MRAPWLFAAVLGPLLVLPNVPAQTQGNTTGRAVTTCGAASLTAGNPTPVEIKIDGTLCISGTATITPSTATTGTQSSVASSASAVTILAANASRKGATIYNESTQVCYLLLSATTATSGVYTLQMAANAYYEVPFNYTGIIQGFWASANGFARVTELQ